MESLDGRQVQRRSLLPRYNPDSQMKRRVRAFVYLATSLGKEKEVAAALWKLPEIKEVHIVPGKYDVMAVVEVERKMLQQDSQSIYWFILDRIENIRNIVDTETLIPIVSMSKWST